MTQEELLIKVQEIEELVKSGKDYAFAEKQAREMLIGDIHELELYCRILLTLSQSLWLRGMANTALPYAKKALVLAEDHKDKALIARAMGNIGIVYKNLSDYGKALEYHSCALITHEELDNKNGIAVSMGNIGGVYHSLSNYGKALEYYSRSLALHEELGNTSGVANNTGNIGNVYMHLSDYEKALEYHSRAIMIHEELGNTSGVAIYAGNIGNVYSLLLKHDKALEYYNRALTLHEELGDTSGMALCIGNIGTVYIELSDYGKALEYFIRALTLDEALGNKSGVAINTGNIGIVYAYENYENHDAEKAEEFLLKALAIVEEIGVKKVQYMHHKSLADLYEKQERWKDFAFHHKKFYELEKEVQSEEAKKQAERLDYERKTAERQKALAIERATAASERKILNNILPEEITQRLIKGENPIADTFDCVSILFMDIVDFTTFSTKISAQQLVHLLNAIFTSADAVMREFGLEKIKTIGDAYMAVAGAPIVQEDHAHRAANAAVKLLDVMQNLVVSFPLEYGDRSWIESIPEIEVRIGLHCGPAAAGVVGENKFLYDLWGDAVNTAARMESHGEAGKIHCSADFMRAVETVHPPSLRFIPRGEMEIKGKGTMKTYFLEKLSEQDL